MAKRHKKSYAKIPKKKQAAVSREIKKEMHLMHQHKLHSGSKKGPLVRNPKQVEAIAIKKSLHRKW
jgi:hypothetical protein